MTKKLYACIECGYETSKWMGKCIRCGEWGTLKEIEVNDRLSRDERLKNQITSKKIISISTGDKSSLQRLNTGFDELDRVLGGGLVKGEVVILGGEPGIGKTTLLMQVLNNVEKQKKRGIYVSAEESLEQISTHADRLKLDKNIEVICSNDIDSTIGCIKDKDLDLVIIDSIQTIRTEDMKGLSGGVGQVKECTSRIVDYAKTKGVPVILVGHITKEGDIAGPKVIEHLVDAVLYIEGDASTEVKVIKSLKNRFGSTREIGVFNFSVNGFSDASSTSEIFLQSHEPRVGVCKGIIFEGHREILTEVQALTVKNIFNIPQRVVKGISKAKVKMICALLTKYTRANLQERDVYMNIANNLKVEDNSLDLSVAISLLSSYFNKQVKPSRIAIGEISLTGKIYSTYLIKEKITSVRNLGYDEVLVPLQSRTKLGKGDSKGLIFVDDISKLAGKV